MSARAKKLYYTGGGYFPGVPRRDLEERDINRMTDDRYRQVTAKPKGGSAVYQTSKPAGRDPKKKAPARRRSRTKAAKPLVERLVEATPETGDNAAE